MERIDTFICMTESLCCSPETITTLLIGCAPIQLKGVFVCLFVFFLMWNKKIQRKRMPQQMQQKKNSSIKCPNHPAHQNIQPRKGDKELLRREAQAQEKCSCLLPLRADSCEKNKKCRALGCQLCIVAN